ncbi:MULTISPECIES: DUF3311 domain-containing protein [Burkholderia]|jgi:hypothetical protein|uniref:DUF3311 domain-containing protein n=2 Tax=Burkholderia gladioli TaxID=28095 RepID=A0AB38TNT9_BURGA|nr:MULTISPECIES: DUF3311 domain-containing protein [Burkholderia]AEA61636.1 hypothetical protein bgla_1g30250 [Burkholderia gladioli BSR3]AYQ89290.1 DUF3311 domain-containing protein [Burkholderia gladioli]KGE08572.1 hypothetical protein LA03_20780 [Burkholderia gladioli]MBU9196057.1 DUF3311 domain-containing protein [Burkholderia gladioli]MBW5283421.1 DUF3311 domain-containing protein [Burkholderia gladioli]
MAHEANANQAAKRWLWLLVLPVIAMVWVPSYSKVEPQWLGFPFFYWYQLAWVFGSAAITGFVYSKTKHCWRANPAKGDAQ